MASDSSPEVRTYGTADYGASVVLNQRRTASPNGQGFDASSRELRSPATEPREPGMGPPSTAVRGPPERNDRHCGRCGGDPLGALKRVALRDDAPALALRGIAMAQLGDLPRAKALLRSAARASVPGEAVARARCVVAEAEIALVSRDLGGPRLSRRGARDIEAHGDVLNAAHARYLSVRRPPAHRAAR